VIMRPPVRRLALVCHVAASVGWLGAVVASLVLGALGLASTDPAVVPAAYRVLEPLGWTTLLPFSLASLLTGLIQALGSTWGLIRHYWVLVKLVMNLFASAVLLLYMQTLGYLADLARAAANDKALRSPSPVAHGAAAIGLLVVALVLSVYKPRGLTPWGQRRQAVTRRANGQALSNRARQADGTWPGSKAVTGESDRTTGPDVGTLGHTELEEPKP
jgi:hypothetical protein